MKVLDESLRTKLNIRKRIFLKDKNANESFFNNKVINNYISIEESDNSNSFKDQAELNLPNIYLENDKINLAIS